MSAVASGMIAEEGFGVGEVCYTPHSLTHILSISVSIVVPLLSGCRMVLFDTWDPDRIAEIIDAEQVTVVSAAAVFVNGIVKSLIATGSDASSLRYLISGGEAIPPKLVRDVYKALGVPLRAAFGMTEIPVGTWTRATDPPDWAAQSDGRPGPAVEFDLRADGEISRAEPASLYVRGAGLCLAFVGRDSGAVEILADRDDGWFNTGDLVVPDGRDGIRHVGRVADRIGGLMIPVADVEAQLLEHPAIAAVAVVGYLDADGRETGCAVVVADGTPPTFDEMRAYLTAEGMTETFQPTRLEVVPVLPRNPNGKVLKRELRTWVQQRAGVPA
jgi:cyclohexanecarboxylate-CoA ligase